MTSALRAVTARRGHDPRKFTLVSFGGAGGLHACALADALEIPRVLVPPYAGVLSALGMVVAPPLVDMSRTVVHLAATLTDSELEAEFLKLATQASHSLADDQTATTEYFADVRFRGQSHEIKIPLEALTLPAISRRFYDAYRKLYGRPPRGRAIELVTLRVRRTGHAPRVELPTIPQHSSAHDVVREAEIIDATGANVRAAVLTRGELLQLGQTPGPIILIDPEATTLVPPGWNAESDDRGIVLLTRRQ
jgi:N-methylhydantoinase A/oxoprolinase/acetone carboxylase beta subunit